MRGFAIVLLTLGMVPWFTGCSTAPANSDSAWDDSDSALRKLQKGMTAEQVRTVWGEPKKIAPMEAPTGRAEVWTYVFSLAGPARQVQSSEITYTRPNPLTGVDETMSEPVYSIEQTWIKQTVDLLFYEGRLTE